MDIDPNMQKLVMIFDFLIVFIFLFFPIFIKFSYWFWSLIFKIWLYFLFFANYIFLFFRHVLCKIFKPRTPRKITLILWYSQFNSKSAFSIENTCWNDQFSFCSAKLKSRDFLDTLASQRVLRPLFDEIWLNWRSFGPYVFLCINGLI